MSDINRNSPSEDLAKEVGELLGSSKVIKAWRRTEDVETNLERLTARFAERLVSNGGRPTDPSWKLSRRVPLTPDTWATLQALSAQVGSAGRSVAPAQIAAALLEESVAELDAIINSRKHESD